MKILMVSPPAETVLRGGLWKQVRHTTEALRSMNVQVDLYHPEMGQRIREYDLCHVIGANIGSYQLVREIHRKGLPVVASPVFYSRHSPGYVRRALGFQRFLARFARGIWVDYTFVADICNWATALLPNTVEEGDFIGRAFGVPPGKMIIVPNGVEERFYDALPGAFEEKYGLRNFVLYVGHFGPTRKNVLQLIRGINRLGVPGVVIGESKDRDYEELCRKEAGKNVLMIDGLPEDSELLGSAYAAAAVFVLPSDYETPGIAALEAGLAGAKVVITKYGGTKEYFGKWAAYVDPKSEESITEGIRSMLAKPRTDDLREHIRKNFLWRIVAEKTLEVYKRVVSEAGGSS